MLTRCVEIPPLFGICLEINPIIKIVPICLFYNIQTESLSCVCNAKFQEFHPRMSTRRTYLDQTQRKSFQRRKIGENKLNNNYIR